MEANDTTTNSTSNSTTSYADVYDELFLIVIISVYVIIIVTAIGGNLLVCLAISLNKRLQKATNYFIFSLAISDLLTASCSMPFDVQVLLKPNGWKHGEFVCNFWTFVYLIVAPTSLLNLTAVSIARYQAISAPLRYYDKMRPRRAIVIIATIWLYSLTFAVVGMAAWPYYDHSVNAGMCFFNISPYYSVLSSAMNFILPTVVMCVVYFKIYQIASAHAHRIVRQEVSTTAVASCSNEDSGNITSEKKRLKRNIQAAKTIAIIVSAFFLCWIPFTLVSTITSLCQDCISVSDELFNSLLVVAYMNSALKPILYSFLNRDFRDAFKKLLKFQFKFRYT
ncbi:octopamine receptor beta-1R-like [Montipora foliosa]|uniref:octopamine receptor beta-1R-like n=1 Tax=Montipora foliosa TaxID=591990 RepID=UPI0035F17F7C